MLMKVINKNKGTILSKDATLCPHLLQKARGLMLMRQRDLVFEEKKERIVPLHMWFVFYTIDVVFANKDMKVVECKENFHPFSFYTPKKKAKYIIEVQAGKIHTSKTIQGDFLEFQ